MRILDRGLDLGKTKASYKKIVWFHDFWSWLRESKAAKKILELAELKDADNQTILEVACGTGVVFEKIVAKNPKGVNIGLDLSPSMLDKARQRISKLGAKNVELKEGNVLDLDIQDESIDTLINNFMIDLMPEDSFDKIASEFYRILKPKGIAVISVFSFGEKRVHKFWYWVAANLPDLLTGCRPVSIKEHLIKAGFVIEEDHQISQNTFPSEIIKARKGS